MKTKLYLILIAAFIMPLFAQSQYGIEIHDYSPAPGNPGDLHATEEQPAPTGWTNLYTGTGTPVMSWSSNVTLPFSFMFAGSPVTHFKVSNTGVLTFDTSAAMVPDTSSRALPHSSIPDMSVCMWGLKGSGTNDQINYRVFGSSPNRQLWVYYSSFDGPGSSAGCWFYGSIVLEETSNSIFVVDQRAYPDLSLCPLDLSIGVQIDGSTAVQHSASPNYKSLSQDLPTADDNVFHEFRFGPSDNYNLTAYNILNNDYLKRGDGPFVLDMAVVNHGATTISSVDISYQVDSDPVVTDNVSGLSIAPGATGVVSTTTPWNPAMDGQYNVKMWASNLNGYADEYMRWDETEKSFIVYDTAATKRVMVEMFTSSTCGPCVLANQNLKPAVALAKDDCAVIKYQMNWPGSGDIYYTAEGGQRRTPYAVTSIPMVFFDGFAVDARSNSGTILASALSARANQVPGFIGFDASYNLDSPTMDVHVNIESFFDLGSGYNLYVGLVERETTGNVGSNGETEFQYVMMDLLPDGNGTALPSITKGYTNSYDWTIPLAGTNVEEYDDLAVVAWVAHPTTLDVANSAWAYDLNSSVENPLPGVSFLNVFPNPSTDFGNVHFTLEEEAEVEVRLLNINGSEISKNSLGNLGNGQHQSSFDVSHLSAGVYLVELKVNGQTIVRTLAVQ